MSVVCVAADPMLTCTSFTHIWRRHLRAVSNHLRMGLRTEEEEETENREGINSRELDPRRSGATSSLAADEQGLSS